MSIIEYLTIYLGMGFVVGALLSIVLTAIKAYEIDSMYINFWAIIWDNCQKINNVGKIILEVLYTIVSLPFIVVYYIMCGLCFCLYFIFKKRN